MNYAVVGRFAGSGVTGGALALAAAACLWLTVRYARTLDTTFAALVTFGLVLSPLLWSQHLTLAVVPLAVLLGHVLRQDSSLPLAAWAVLAMLFSLPDPAFVDLSAILMPVPASGAPPSLAPLLPLALWIALLWTGRRVASAPDTAREPAPVAAR